MATLNTVILPAKALKGGRHKVRISVAHNSETRYIVTDIIIDSSKEFRNGVIVNRPDSSFLNTKLRKLLNTYQQAIDDIEYSNGMTCSELIEVVKASRTTKLVSFKEVFDEILRSPSTTDSTKYAYNISFKRISKFINTSAPIISLTTAIVQKIMSKLQEQRYSNASIIASFSILKLIVTYAKRSGYVQLKIDPFGNLKLPRKDIRDSWLTVEEIKKLRDAEFKTKSQTLARDMLLLSYYLGGINMADLVQIDFNKCKNRISYVRQKIKNRVSTLDKVTFDIPDEAKDIINKYKGSDGHLTINKKRSGYLRTIINYNLHKIGEILDMPNIVFYSGRKSFSQHAFNLGIGTMVIDYLLGHKISRGGSCLYHYVAVSPETASAALRKVLDNLK